MKKILLLAVVVVLFISCSKVAMTKRKQIILIPSSHITKMSFSQYQEFKKNNRISKDQKNGKLVKKVGYQIKNAVEKYLKRTNQLDLVKGFDWEFHLFQGRIVNAWCMPGGKVAFYDGIIPIAKNENGIATVMGHEIAHAIAEHGRERMSQDLLVKLGGVTLLAALNSKPAMTKKMWMSAYGVGAQYGATLPFSRKHEYEADEMGLMFMAMAGYDPRGSVSFWERMRGGKKDGSDYTSTHPSNTKRIKQLQRLMPKAMEYYKRSQG